MKTITLTDAELSRIMYAISQRIEILENQVESLLRTIDEHPEYSFARDTVKNKADIYAGFLSELKEVEKKLKACQ